MSTSSPESYRGLMQKANEVYEEALILVQGTDSDGFRRLTSWDSIDQAVEDLAAIRSILGEKIKELKKDSPQKKKYNCILEKIDKRLTELRDKQRERNKPKNFLG